AEADAALAFVDRLHQRVRGELPDAAGPWPAGTSYSAFDPPLMLWTIAVIADSAEAFYESLVRRLSDEEKDSLWRDYVRFGELFGMPREIAPARYTEFREYWEAMWTGGELHLTDEAREVALAVAFQIPMPRYLHPSREVHNLVLTGTLPERVRRMFGLRWTPLHAAAFRAAVAGLRTARPITPEAIRHGTNTASFEMVARTEKRLVAGGRATLPTAASTVG
ncbi:MAG: oxygenase MpaB family protein, partial [Solirubrobacterales bacterium]